jgi:gluconokinase
VHSTYPAFKLLHLKENGLSLVDKYIAGQGSYNFYHLTGVRATTPCMVSGAGLLDIEKWSYDAPILKEIGIADEQLGRLKTYKETCPLSKKGAGLLGLKQGIPVVLPHADGALNQVGAGALKEGVMTFSVGTSAAIRLTTDGVRLPQKPSTWCYLTADTWLSGAAISGACSNVDWAKNTLFPAGTSYEEIEDSFSDNGDLPVFMPFLYGERCPGWQDDRKSGFCGVLPWHTANDLYISVIESVLFNVYQCYEVLCSLNPPPGSIKLSGGILRSKLWTQMCADIFGQEMQCSKTEQSSLLGGAVLAMAAGGVLKDPRSFDPGPDDIVMPNLGKKQYYSHRYKEYCYWYNKTMIND